MFDESSTSTSVESTASVDAPAATPAAAGSSASGDATAAATSPALDASAPTAGDAQATTDESGSTTAAAPELTDEQLQALPEQVVNPIRQQREHIKALEQQLAETRQVAEVVQQLGGVEALEPVANIAAGIFSDNPAQGWQALYEQSPAQTEKFIESLLDNWGEYVAEKMQAKGLLPEAATAQPSAPAPYEYTAEDLAHIPADLHDTLKNLSRAEADVVHGAQTLEQQIAALQRFKQANEWQQFKAQHEEQQKQAQRLEYEKAVQADRDDFYKGLRGQATKELESLKFSDDPTTDSIIRNAILDHVENELYRDNQVLPFIEQADAALNAREKRQLAQLKVQLNAHRGRIQAPIAKAMTELLADARAGRELRRQQQAGRPEVSGASASRTAGGNGKPSYFNSKGEISDEYYQSIASLLPKR